MKYIFVALLTLLIASSSVFAAATKIYDKDGFRLGTCNKNGTVFEAYDMNGKPILKDALNNDVPSDVLYFYDMNGNLIRFSNEKRTIAPVNIEFNEPEHKIYKAPLYRNYRLKTQKSF